MGYSGRRMMAERLSTGVEGLDEVLHGGLLPGQAYLLRGRPGAGKTTLALQFLMEGVRRGESALYVTLNESEAELRAGAAAHGWDLGDLEILEILPGDEDLSPESQYSIFHPGDVELAPTTRKITEAMERRKPTRVAFDSLTEVRLLSRDAVRYRRQVLALKGFLRARGATTLFLGESAHPEYDVEAATIAHGVIALEQELGPDGMDRRHLRVEKYRGSDYEAGMHAVRIVRGGLEVYPRLVAPLKDPEFEPAALASGIAALDRLFGGGLDRGTCTMIGGNSGVGKSSLGLAFLAAAAAEGDRGVLYSFDEWPAEVIHRCESIGLAVRGPIGAGPAERPEGQPPGPPPRAVLQLGPGRGGAGGHPAGDDRHGQRLRDVHARPGRVPQPPPAARRLPEVQGRHADPGLRDRQGDRRADDVRDRDELHLRQHRAGQVVRGQRGVAQGDRRDPQAAQHPRRPIPRVPGDPAGHPRRRAADPAPGHPRGRAGRTGRPRRGRRGSPRGG